MTAVTWPSPSTLRTASGGSMRTASAAMVTGSSKCTVMVLGPVAPMVSNTGGSRSTSSSSACPTGSQPRHVNHATATVSARTGAAGRFDSDSFIPP